MVWYQAVRYHYNLFFFVATFHCLFTGVILGAPATSNFGHKAGRRGPKGQIIENIRQVIPYDAFPRQKQSPSQIDEENTATNDSRGSGLDGKNSFLCPCKQLNPLCTVSKKRRVIFKNTLLDDNKKIK